MKFWLENDKLCSDGDLSVFNKLQQMMISLGLVVDLDVSIYARPDFRHEQMVEIILGLMKDLNVSIYAKPEFNVDQMACIRIGLELLLDVGVYAKSEFDYLQMEQIRLGLAHNVELAFMPSQNLIGNKWRTSF